MHLELSEIDLNYLKFIWEISEIDQGVALFLLLLSYY